MLNSTLCDDIGFGMHLVPKLFTLRMPLFITIFNTLRMPLFITISITL